MTDDFNEKKRQRNVSLRKQFARARRSQKYLGMSFIEFAKIQASRTDGKTPYGEPHQWARWLEDNVK